MSKGDKLGVSYEQWKRHRVGQKYYITQKENPPSYYAYWIVVERLHNKTDEWRCFSNGREDCLYFSETDWEIASNVHFNKKEAEKSIKPANKIVAQRREELLIEKVKRAKEAIKEAKDELDLMRKRIGYTKFEEEE